MLFRSAVKCVDIGRNTSGEGDYLEVMITLIEAYEAKHFPVDLPNPVDAIRFRMEQSGLSPPVEEPPPPPEPEAPQEDEDAVKEPPPKPVEKPKPIEKPKPVVKPNPVQKP